MCSETSQPSIDSSTPDQQRTDWLRFALAGLLLLCGGLWLAYASSQQSPRTPITSPTPVKVVDSGTVASMDSPAIAYSRGWQVTAEGASPPEPDEPWIEPSGIITIPYSGNELALNLGVGDYWGYLYVKVDGEPANRLPYIRGNNDSTGSPAGYRTFYAPEYEGNGLPGSQWVVVHTSDEADREHVAVVEVWRSWGQQPIRGIAIDGLTPRSPAMWTGMLLLVIGLALIAGPALRLAAQVRSTRAATSMRRVFQPLLLPHMPNRVRLLMAFGFTVLTAVGIALAYWIPAVVGLAGLGVLSLGRPALWAAVLLYALPFYYRYHVPIIPNRSVGLIDLLALGGFVIAVAHWFLADQVKRPVRLERDKSKIVIILLIVIVGWALVSVFAASRMGVALYEWRTVFLSAALFAVLLYASLRWSDNPVSDLWLIIGGWLAGGVTVAVIGLAQFALGTDLIAAEGVQRVRGLYGSPNNLALYLERTLLVTIALAAFLRNQRWQVVLILAAGVQLVALVLTFSKGSILVAMPTGLLILWLGGLAILARQERSQKPLYWLAVVGIVGVLLLLPFLGAERFKGLFDLSQGTAYLRLQLWRSSLQMAKDHLLLGVGPDNFLYSYRSTYLLPHAWQEPNLNHPHNWVLDWWTRIGLPGLVLAVTMFSLGLYWLWNRTLDFARPVGAIAALGLGLLAAGLAALMHGLIDASFALPDLMLVWVLLLLAVALLPDADAITD